MAMKSQDSWDFLNTCFVNLQIIIKLVNCNLNFNNQNLISIQQKKKEKKLLKWRININAHKTW